MCTGAGEHYTPDADFVNIFGVLFSGKIQIEERHQEIHRQFLKGSTFTVVQSTLREAASNVVIAHVNWMVAGIQSPTAENMKGIFTHTFIKAGEKWQIAASQNTLTRG